MPQVTALTPTPRNPDRIAVKVDGKRVATLASQRVAELGLRIGKEVDDQLAQELDAAVLLDKAIRDAMSSLNRRAQTRRQLDDKLRKKGHDPEVREKALDRLEAIGLVDDAELGRAVARETVRSKPAGPALIRHKLRQRGVDPKLAGRLAEEAAPTRDEQVEAALSFARQRLRTMTRLDPAARQRRLYGQLARRGFDPDVLRQVMDRLRNDLGPDDDAPLD